MIKILHNQGIKIAIITGVNDSVFSQEKIF